MLCLTFMLADDIKLHQRITIFIVDLLAKGKTTGQAMRLLCDPPRRRAEEKKEAEALAEADPKAAAAQQQQAEEAAAAAAAAAEGEEGATEGEAVPEEEPLLMNRGWFNMVCYGLPNMMVTQIGKA